MKWNVTLLVALAFVAGCHAPKPSFNLLAPYGAPRVPPPSTSAGGNNPAYYTPTGGVPAGPASAAPAASTVPTAGQPGGSSQASAPYMATNQSWTSVLDKTAKNAGAPATVTTIDGDVRMAAFAAEASKSAPADDGGSTLRSGGMQVNDATAPPSPPAVFVAPSGASPISHLPAPPTAMNPNAAADAKTVTATAQSSDAAASGSAAEAGKSTLQWKTRN